LRAGDQPKQTKIARGVHIRQGPIRGELPPEPMCKDRFQRPVSGQQSAAGDAINSPATRIPSLG